MSEIEHTPMPWWNESGVIHAKAVDWTPQEHRCCHPASANQNIDPEDGDPEANAEFIVRACNSHDNLLAACKESCAMLARIARTNRTPIHINKVIARDQAVIAEAEPKKEADND